MSRLNHHHHHHLISHHLSALMTRIRKFSSSTYHLPVMLSECCEYLNIKPNHVYLDCTLGGGGHTFAILERGGNVIAIDQDFDSIKKIQNDPLFSSYLSNNKLELAHTNFSNLKNVINSSQLCQRLGYQSVHGVLFDLGISSYQIDNSERGFSYRYDDSPLDMRMSQQRISTSSSSSSSPSSSITSSHLTAADLINTLSIEELSNIFYYYSDERRSRQIATEIIATRPHYTSLSLRQAIENVTHPHDQIKTLSRCYQALRIVINQEIQCLRRALSSLHEVTAPSGRLVVLSYHSLEDRIIKKFLQKRKQKKQKIDRDYEGEEEEEGEEKEGEIMKDENEEMLMRSSIYWKEIKKGVIKPKKEEIQANNRARSAKLRVGERI